MVSLMGWGLGAIGYLLYLMRAGTFSEARSLICWGKRWLEIIWSSLEAIGKKLPSLVVNF